MTDSLTELIETEATQSSDADKATQENFLSRYVGEDKKYKSEEDLAKAYEHAQKHIQKLESENHSHVDQLAQYTEKTTALEQKIDEIIGKVNSTKASEEPTTVVEKTTQSAPRNNEDDLETKVAAALDKVLTKQKQQDNVKATRAKLAEVYGEDNVAKVLAEVVSGNADKRQMVDTLSRQSPDELLNYFKAVRPPQDEIKTNSTDLKPRFKTEKVPDGPQPNTWSYFQKLRKENPRAYEKSRPQISRLAQEYRAAGKDFYQT